MAWCTGLAPGAEVSAAEVAYVEVASTGEGAPAGEHGVAWLFSRGGVCYGLTPLHVLRDESRGRDARYARLVVARPGATPGEAQADRCAISPEHDLALLRVSGLADLADCGRSLVGEPSTDELIASSSTGSLLSVTRAGSLRRSTLAIRAATVSEPNYFWVAPASDKDRLTQGMSGSLVAVRDTWAGFLMSVQDAPDEPDGTKAKVLKIDRAIGLVHRMFFARAQSDGSTDACMERSPSSPAGRPAEPAPGRPGDLDRARESCGARVLHWSVPPLSENTRPENLLGDTQGHLFWRAANAGEVELDIGLCKHPQGRLSRVRMDATGCEANESGDYDVEALVRGGADGAYLSLGYGRLPPSGILEIVSDSPLVGGQIRLRFAPRTATTRRVCVRSVSVE